MTLRLHYGALLLVALLGCSRSPKEVFLKMEEAARKGNVKEFGSYFTEESRPFAEALLALYKSQSPAEGPVPDALSLLSASTVVSEEVQDHVAYVDVRTSPDSPVRILVFTKEEGRWKLDLRATEKKNGTSSRD